MNAITQEIMYIEIQEIFKYLSDDLYIKIPLKIRDYVENYKGSGKYSFKYDITKPLKDQNISKQTKDFIALLHLECWCTKSEKDELVKMMKQNSTV